ncbi:KICSTOR complex protein kaptin-like isoform X3 [Xenia sp. Carnegie-2017]|uniref:KICSTOR complex protein kaptin-like isoform X3 n=1 Tax=Xenia sp. Carnegie-2017 TaxID=2897299 RepID=UPI001F033D47|nr:KICSTOR complex protein kaptin-like isoform X3 [Xenia sp. Carnegie-2017]
MADEDEETENKIGLNEIQFFPSSSQTNIYGLVKFYDTVHGCNKVLMASLKGSVTCITSQQSARPTSTLSSHNLSLRNLQGSDIVSIDAFESDSIFYFGVTYIKNGHTSHERKFLNIYSGSTAFQNELSFDNFQTFDLEFVPFQLIHANTTKETVFLLSGGDRKIHLFKQNDKTQLFVECKVEDYFLEFKDLPSSVISMDIYYDMENKRRISAYACQNGTLKVALCTEKAVMKEWLTSHDGPISSVKFFTFEANSREVSEEMKALLASTRRKNVIKYTNCGVVHLLVTAVIEPSVVYEDVINNGLNKFIILPDSDQYDCVLCSHVNDLTWSGTNEILLGTYGQCTKCIK